MRKTSAYSSVIVGFLVGLLVYVSTDNIVLAALAFVGIGVVGFIAIRFIEQALSKGVDAAVGATVNAYKRHKENSTK